MNTLLPQAMSLIHEGYNIYEVVPFGLSLDEFSTYAMGQFQKRMSRLEKARNQSIVELGVVAMEEVIHDIP